MTSTTATAIAIAVTAATTTTVATSCLVRERLDVFEHFAHFEGLCAEQLRAPTKQNPTSRLDAFHRVHIVVGGLQGLHNMAHT